MIAYKHLPFILLLFFIMPTTMLCSTVAEEPVYAYRQKKVSIGSPAFDKFENDPVMELLGENFDEIKQVLGEPAAQGYSSWLGPHNYILYRSKQGVIQFCSPESMDDKVAISIILGPGQEVLGAKVGMRFSEIMAVLGAPDRGPELGMNNLYYMDYHLGKFNHQVPEIIISFSAADINGSTQDAFIKWEAYEYNQRGQLQTAR
ncbi:MAG: hypothetical protein R6U91_01405 [Bacillota bacterium]